ncbi:MAG: hypothetical protein FWD37_02825 [Methanomassiliicoccaceae archaeon]|nr:hypothetical protein [Methanomassiliicoccaceae archaeon]
MFKVNAAVIVTALIFGTIILGQSLIYLSVPNNYGADAEIKAGEAEYSVSTDSSIRYTALAFDNARPVNTLYVYYDESYAVFGITHAQQNRFISQTIAELKIRSFTDTKIVNAAELADIVKGPYEPGDAILMTSGVLPDTVYQNATVDIFKWVTAGGSLYWAGYAIGEKVAEKGKEPKNVSNYQTAIFGKENVILMDQKISSQRSSNTNAKALGEALAISNNAVAYGLKVSGSGALTGVLSIGYEYNGYASLALVGKGSGMICVTGSLERTSLAQVISSGVSEKSKLLDSENGSLVRGAATGTLDWGASGGKIAVQIRMGTPNIVYARTFFSP